MLPKVMQFDRGDIMCSREHDWKPVSDEVLDKCQSICDVGAEAWGARKAIYCYGNPNEWMLTAEQQVVVGKAIHKSFCHKLPLGYEMVENGSIEDGDLTCEVHDRSAKYWAIASASILGLQIKNYRSGNLIIARRLPAESSKSE